MAFAADPLLPRDAGGHRTGALLALGAHAALLAALTLSVQWRVQPPEPVVAELWAALPQAAGPAPAPSPTPAPAPPPPPPTPAPAPPKAPPPAPAPAPAAQPPSTRDADIAVERAARLQRERDEADERQRIAAAARREAEQQRAAQAREAAERRRAETQQAERKLAEQKAAQQKADDEQLAERRRADAERRQAERERVAEQRRRDEQTRVAEQAREAERQQRADAERKALADARAKADEERLARQREDNLRRMQASAAQDAAGSGRAAGGSGGGSGGAAAPAGAPSADYGARIVAAVRPNIVFTGAVSSVATAEVEVRTAAGGSVLSRRLVKSSGNDEWDQAVLRAIDRTGTLPRDVDGRVPGTLTLAFRPRE